MTTTLLNAEVALSKELGDFWDSTTTSAGSAGGTTIVDTALKAKTNDWISEEAYTYISSGTNDEEERKISSLDNSSGTLTVLAHGAQVANSVTYRVHRLFEASEKRRALITAAKNIFPACFQEVWNEELVCGNWINDGSIERWTNSTTPSQWTVDTVTATQTTSSPYYIHGATSCKLDTSAGKITQGITDFDDLKHLRGRNVTFTIQGWSDTASCLRIAIYDGSTRTYSSYHAGDSAWTQRYPKTDDMYVTAFIDYNPTEITFEIYHDVAAGTSYVDDTRGISDYRGKLYIGHLGLAQNRPHQVLIEPNYYSQEEEWIKLRDYKIDKDDYLYIPTTYPSDYRLRIRGIGYLDFIDSSGDSGTDWADTIDLNEPELKILTAQAALYLYTWMSMPNYETGTRKDFQEAMSYWAREVDRRKAQFGMKSPGASIMWGVH